MVEESAGGRWHLQLLGGFRLAGPDGIPVTGLGSRDRALLAYLALSRRQHQRAKLAALLWPDRFRTLHSLSESLRLVRKALGDRQGSIIVSKSDPVICRFGSLDVDVLIFEDLVSQDTMEALECAEALYGGDLLGDVEIGSEKFSEWLQEERERLRRLAVDGLCRLARLRQEAGLSQAALETAQRV